MDTAVYPTTHKFPYHYRNRSPSSTHVEHDMIDGTFLVINRYIWEQASEGMWILSKQNPMGSLDTPQDTIKDMAQLGNLVGSRGRILIQKIIDRLVA